MTATLSGSAAREAAGFLRAICEQPGDDTPRLAGLPPMEWPTC